MTFPSKSRSGGGKPSSSQVGRAYLGIGEARVLLRVDVQEVTLYNAFPYHISKIIKARAGTGGRTYGLLSEDGTLRKALHEERVAALPNNECTSECLHAAVQGAGQLTRRRSHWRSCDILRRALTGTIPNADGREEDEAAKRGKECYGPV